MAWLLFGAVSATQAAEFGTREEANATLDKAIAAVKEDKERALGMFNNGESGFKDRDLYVLCANASDGTITASPMKHTFYTKIADQICGVGYWE